jgi:hypothetical protein
VTNSTAQLVQYDDRLLWVQLSSTSGQFQGRTRAQLSVQESEYFHEVKAVQAWSMLFFRNRVIVVFERVSVSCGKQTLRYALLQLGTGEDHYSVPGLRSRGKCS